MLEFPNSFTVIEQTYLKNVSVSSKLQDEFVELCTRARYSQDLANSSGLSALLAAGKETTTSVEGGNRGLVERLIRLSYVNLRLQSGVTAIEPGE